LQTFQDGGMERLKFSDVELTQRQREVLHLIVKGHTNTEIAAKLGISMAGAKWHVSELLGKFGVESREELVEAWDRSRSWRARTSGAARTLRTLLLVKPALGVLGGAVACIGVAAVAIVVVAFRQTSAGVASAPNATAIQTGQAVTPGVSGPTPRDAVQRVAWLDGIPGGPWVGVSPNPDGEGWCSLVYSADGSKLWGTCGLDPLRQPSIPVDAGGASVVAPDGTRTDVQLVMITRADVAKIVVLPGDGRTLNYSTAPVPASLGWDLRFTFVSVGTAPGEVTVIGYDAGGHEVGRAAFGGGAPLDTPTP